MHNGSNPANSCTNNKTLRIVNAGMHIAHWPIASNLASHPLLANSKLTGSIGSPLVSPQDLSDSRCLHADAHQVMSHAAVLTLAGASTPAEICKCDSKCNSIRKPETCVCIGYDTVALQCRRTSETWHCGGPWPLLQRNSGTRLGVHAGLEQLCAGVGQPRERPCLPAMNIHLAPICSMARTAAA